MSWSIKYAQAQDMYFGAPGHKKWNCGHERLPYILCAMLSARYFLGPVKGGRMPPYTANLKVPQAASKSQYCFVDVPFEQCMPGVRGVDPCWMGIFIFR